MGGVSDAKNPLEQALDLFFYAPIGLLFNAEEVIPSLIEKGKQQASMAKVFGQFAVQAGQAEAGKVAERLQAQLAARTSRPAAAPPAAEAPAAPARPSPSTNGASAPVGPPVETLAITDYDSLSASQVVPRLEGLSVDELEAVRSYEAANRGRKTILSKIAQLES